MILSCSEESLTYSSKRRTKRRSFTPVACCVGWALTSRGGCVSYGPPSGEPWLAQPQTTREQKRNESAKRSVLFVINQLS